MRKLAAYEAKQREAGIIRLSRCTEDSLESIDTRDWLEAVTWLVAPPANDITYFTVVWSLRDFTRVLFSLLPDELRDRIINEDRVYHDGVKVFYANGRYLGITVYSPDTNSAAVIKAEINLASLDVWVGEGSVDVPADIGETRQLGIKILKILDEMSFYPTKLTSPIAVFCDCYLGDARRYPTVFNFNMDDFGEAMEWATEIMRHEWRSAYQIGFFEETHSYDLVSAYPSMIARLPSMNSLRNVYYGQTIPDWTDWGIMYGEVEVDSDVSPIVFDIDDTSYINPRGRWKDLFTTGLIRWLEGWGVGKFRLENGWFFQFNLKEDSLWNYPYRRAVNYLTNMRIQYQLKGDTLAETIIKRMGQGLSGKLDEDRQDGKKGDFYNPIYALMVRSGVRIKVADFIYEKGLQNDLVAVQVDGVRATRYVTIPQLNGIGCWRYDGCEPALVLSKGQVWSPSKRPFGIEYQQVLDAMMEQPERGYYEFTKGGGKHSIDLLLDATEPDRIYDRTLECGREVLGCVSRSRPITMRGNGNNDEEQANYDLS